MPTYYRWKKSTFSYGQKITEYDPPIDIGGWLYYSEPAYAYLADGNPDIEPGADGLYHLTATQVEVTVEKKSFSNKCIGQYNNTNKIIYCSGDIEISRPAFTSVGIAVSPNFKCKNGIAQVRESVVQVGDFVEYVYDTSASAYPNGGVYSGYYYSERTLVNIPTLLSPSVVMIGQQVDLRWTSETGADSYTLQRKLSTDEDWVQVYTGANTSYAETAGAWTSVQYRVRAVFDDGPGEWATSDSIPVVSASALVISGQDGDLGTLVNDVPYTISTDTGNPITIRTTVNGAVILDGTITSGTAECIPVLDLVNGDGTIVIEASVEADSGTASAVRTWTYTKSPITFPNAGSPAQLTKEGKNIWPKTLAECVRLPGGRTLDEVMGFPCQIFVGRYTGTGTYGSGDPNEVTIPFKPQAVFVTSGSVGTTIPMIRPCTSAKNSSATLTVTWEDDSVSWYSTSAANQLNANGTTYDVVAFG